MAPDELQEKPEEAASASPRSKRGHPVPALMLSGVDLNSATSRELIEHLEDIGDGLAYQIIREREKNGPYLDLHDLSRVPGLGPRTFERLTGLPWREGGAGGLKQVLDVLGFSETDTIHTKHVAERFSKLPGFDGCIIAHEEGYVMESCWDNDALEALGAFAPQFSKKLLPYIKQLGLGPMDSMTIFVAERPITLVQYKDLIIVAIHKPNRFSRRQVRLAQQVVRKLRLVMLSDYGSPAREPLDG